MEQLCHVCGEPLDTENVAECNLCGRKFHLTWNVKKPVANCGSFSLQENSLALVFVCHRCAGEAPSSNQ